MTPFYTPGRYLCRIVSQALGKAKTGTPQFILRFTVLGTVDAGDSQNYEPAVQQYERTMYRAITDKTIAYLLEDLKVLGFEHDSFKYLDPNTWGFQDFKGLDVVMFCGHENDQNGESRERWGLDRGPRDVKVDPLESSKLRELDAMFGKQLKGLRSTAKPAQPAAALATGVTDDDVPF